MSQRSTRGGARSGAGRKPKPAGERARRVTITLPPRLIALAESIGGGGRPHNRSAGIAAALALWEAQNPPIPRRVELWRALDGGALYAVQADGGICVDAAGPLDAVGAAAVQAGDTTALAWDAGLGDEIAAAEDTGHAFARVWPLLSDDGALGPDAEWAE